MKNSSHIFRFPNSPAWIGLLGPSSNQDLSSIPECLKGAYKMKKKGAKKSLKKVVSQKIPLQAINSFQNTYLQEGSLCQSSSQLAQASLSRLSLEQMRALGNSLPRLPISMPPVSPVNQTSWRLEAKAFWRLQRLAFSLL